VPREATALTPPTRRLAGTEASPIRELLELAARVRQIQGCTDAGQQLAQMKRLRQVIVRPHFEADDAVDGLAAAGQDDEERFHRPPRVVRLAVRVAPCVSALLLRGRSSSFIQRPVQR